MRVQAVQKNPYNLKTPSFKHWDRTVYKLGTSTGLENVIRRNNTAFFRNPDFWLDLVGFLEKKLKDIPKMNIYSYGCSDGSDPLSLVLIMLAHKRDNLLEKLSPIFAKDVDPLAIARAKSHVYEITPYEESAIDRYTCGKFDKYFKKFDGNSDLVPEANFSINLEASKYVQYSEANILEDYRTIEPNNSIVLIRNILPYITSRLDEPYYKGGDWQVQSEFLENLYNHLGENSYIAIGEYDRYEMRRSLTKMLEKAGFEQTSVYNLYRRISEQEKAEGTSFGEKVLKFFQEILY